MSGHLGHENIAMPLTCAGLYFLQAMETLEKVDHRDLEAREGPGETDALQ